MTLDSMAAPLTLEGDTMWVMNNGIKMFFAPYIYQTALRVDALPEEFNGKWVCSRVDSGGMVMTPSALGMEWTLEIRDSHVIFTNVSFGVKNVYEADGEIIEGVLAFSYTDADDGVEITMPLGLNAAGEMIYPEEGGSTVTYFSRTVDGAPAIVS